MKYDISKYRPCSDGLKWYAGQKTTEDAWNNCHRGDWMLWIVAKVEVDDRTLTLAKGYCAKTVLHLMTDERSRAAVQAAIDYGSGKIERKKFETYIDAAEDVYGIDAAAYAATHATNVNVVAYAAAYTAAYAADINVADINVAVAAASATAEDAYANARDACADDLDTAYTAAYIAAKAKEKNLKETADICRKYLTKAMRRYF